MLRLHNGVGDRVSGTLRGDTGRIRQIWAVFLDGLIDGILYLYYSPEWATFFGVWRRPKWRSGSASDL